jgi:hypothetical protein
VTDAHESHMAGTCARRCLLGCRLFAGVLCAAAACCVLCVPDLLRRLLEGTLGATSVVDQCEELVGSP